MAVSLTRLFGPMRDLIYHTSQHVDPNPFLIMAERLAYKVGYERIIVIE